jgi:hypothetical protein
VPEPAVILVRALVFMLGLRLRLVATLVTDPRRLAMRLPGLEALSEATSLVRLWFCIVSFLRAASLSWS